jgi:uncharacterized membrane protein
MPRARIFLLVQVAAAALGLLFASVSTYDFASHLDRQVHGIHCSFIPGLGAADVSGSSGCHVTLMSPYSSLFRGEIWGGLPISLPAMSVFAFLLFFGLDVLTRRRLADRGATGFLLLATLLPLGASLGMGWLSLFVLDAACKLCIGIYSASLLGTASAFLLWRDARRNSRPSPGGGVLRHAGGFLLGCVFVAVPAGIWVWSLPDYEPFVGNCGALQKAEDPYGVMVSLDPHPGAASTIEVLDPLCPSCRGFEERLSASGLREQLDRKALLFPLDSACNWMVTSAVHPGACAISEAVLCAGDEAPAVVDWAFGEQDSLKAGEAAQPGSAAARAVERFPKLKGCIGSAATKSRLNKSLRWAVANKLPVLTPQVYVDGTKLCDEDTDLGMDWALSRLLQRRGAAGGGGATADAAGASAAAPAPPEEGSR